MISKDTNHEEDGIVEQDIPFTFGLLQIFIAQNSSLDSMLDLSNSSSLSKWREFSMQFLPDIHVALEVFEFMEFMHLTTHSGLHKPGIRSSSA